MFLSASINHVKNCFFRHDEKQLVCVTLLSHFLLPAPFLSFHILEAGTRNVPYSYNNSTEDLYDNDDDFDEESEITVSHTYNVFNMVDRPFSHYPTLLFLVIFRNLLYC